MHNPSSALSARRTPSPPSVQMNTATHQCQGRPAPHASRCKCVSLLPPLNAPTAAVAQPHTRTQQGAHTPRTHAAPHLAQGAAPSGPCPVCGRPPRLPSARGCRTPAVRRRQFPRWESRLCCASTIALPPPAMDRPAGASPSGREFARAAASAKRREQRPPTSTRT